MKRKHLLAVLSGGAALCMALGLSACDIGGHKHTFSQEWSYNAARHWHEATCEHTDLVNDIALHTIENDICTVCGYDVNGNPGEALTDMELAQRALDAIKELYDGTVLETPENYTVIGQVQIESYSFAINWSVSTDMVGVDLADYVTVGTMNQLTKLVTISVVQGEAAVEYTLTASVAINGFTVSVSFPKRVPGAGQSENDGPDKLSDEEIARQAIEVIRILYGGGNYDTYTDYTVVGRVKIGDTFYQVNWSVASAWLIGENVAEYITVSEMDDVTKMVTIGITRSEFDHVYLLTASVTVGSTTFEISFERRVPARLAYHAGTFEDPFTAANVLDIAARLDSGRYYVDESGDPIKVYVRAFVVDPGYESRAGGAGVGRLGNVYIADAYDASMTQDSEGALRVYSLTYDETYITSASDLRAGDEVILWGYIQNYSGIPEFTYNSYDSDICTCVWKDPVYDTPPVVEPEPLPETDHAGTYEDPYSAADALKITSSLEANEYSATAVYVKGYVVDAGSYNFAYGTFTGIYIADAYSPGMTNNSDGVFYVYRVAPDGVYLNEDGDVEVGDLVTFVGYLYNYRGTTPELSYNGDVPVYCVALEKPSAQEKIEIALTALALPETVKSDFAIPMAVTPGVEFTFVSNNRAITVDEASGMFVVTRGEEDAVVTITVTAICGEFAETRAFAVTVLKFLHFALGETVEIEFDFESRFMEWAWGSMYQAHTVSFAEAGEEYIEGSVDFTRADQQSGTITTMPVIGTNNSTEYVTVSLERGVYIRSVAFDLMQWNTKTFNDIHIEYTLDGTMWWVCSESIMTPALLTAAVPVGAIGVRLSVSSTTLGNTQVGLAAIRLTVTSDSGIVEGLTDGELADMAIEAIWESYAQSAMETEKDYTVSGVVVVNGNIYSVGWMVTSSTVNFGDYITGLTRDEATQLVTVHIVRGAASVEYTLTATVTVGMETRTVSFSRVVPAKPVAEHVGTFEDPYSATDAIIVASELEMNAYSETVVYVKGYVVDAGSYNAAYGTFTGIYIADTYAEGMDKYSDGVFLAYVVRIDGFYLTEEGFGVGDLVTFCGYLYNYKGTTPELNTHGDVYVTCVGLEKSGQSAEGSDSDEVEFVLPIDYDSCAIEYVPIYEVGTAGWWYRHMTIDFYAPAGTEVRAMADGTVESISYSPEEGNQIIIDHGNGFKTIYRFVEPVEGLKAGTRVMMGQKIGEVAEAYGSEAVQGEHLHLEMMLNGEYVDPTDYLEPVLDEK